MSGEIVYSKKETELKTQSPKKVTACKKRIYIASDTDDLMAMFKVKLSQHDCSSLASKHNIKFQVNYVYPLISKRVVAHIYRVPEKLKIISDIDYVVEVSGAIWENLDDATRNIVMEHELEHLYITETEEGKLKKALLKHDCEDFRSILSKYGLDWYTPVGCGLEQVTEMMKEKAKNDKKKTNNSK